MWRYRFLAVRAVIVRVTVAAQTEAQWGLFTTQNEQNVSVTFNQSSSE